ncbi:hypothetical protein KUU12_07455 [Pseudomonas aeruginosa]|nr:hypothetical protein [Pseudomonas aeruginosa]
MELLARAKAHYLAAVSLFMAHNDIRYYLNGISIEPASHGGVLLIATNGHHIGVMHDPDGWASNKIIIRPSKALVAGLKKRNACTAFIYERAGVISDSDWDAPDVKQFAPFDPGTLISAQLELVGAKYPDWRRPIPLEGMGSPITAVNPAYLGTFEKVVRIFNRGSAPNLVLRQADPNSLIRCTFPDHEHLKNFFAGVMPCRADHEERHDGLPDFLGLKAKKVA